MENKLIVSEQDLALVDSNALNKNQLQFLLKKTPNAYVKERPAKGGGKWKYVSGGYVKKVLNLMFGWNWSFEILEQSIIQDEVVVKGRLTVTTNGITIHKMQFGNKDIAFRKGTDKYLSIGNDMKSAATDCLKKCAAELGIAADIYNAEEFKEITISEIPTYEDLTELYELKKEALQNEHKKMAERILKNKEEKSYLKLQRMLAGG